ncbi:MAG: hypothetical protein A3A85_06850 [Deltaproteobacteria bacterium RIFCSPLOWO2_01_FULL_42_9]|nr:MAG: hypothetical protein A3A85_06850 [Deltaproteobacteria bacterium RIFCSPLOWO2_01_FULL_42_9]
MLRLLHLRFAMTIKINSNLIYLFLCASVPLWLILFSSIGCKTATPKDEAKTDVEAIDKEGFGSIPFYETGKLSFTLEEAKAKTDARLAREIEEIGKKKDEFQVQAKERFTGDFWIPPPLNPPLVSALRPFPKDFFGYPDWSLAVRRGIISPLDAIKGERIKKEDEEFNRDIIFEINDRMMANVRFPHSVHNYWLSCKVCHPAIFIAKKGANDFQMKDIWDGKYCGRCHGRIAYAPKGFENCIRCHNVRRDKVGF